MSGIENHLLLVFFTKPNTKSSFGTLPCATPAIGNYCLNLVFVIANNKRILETWRLILEIYSVIRAAQKRFAFIMAELRDIEDYLEDY